jgi:hypothetical protein
MNIKLEDLEGALFISVGQVTVKTRTANVGVIKKQVVAIE